MNHKSNDNRLVLFFFGTKINDSRIMRLNFGILSERHVAHSFAKSASRFPPHYIWALPISIFPIFKIFPFIHSITFLRKFSCKPQLGILKKVEFRFGCWASFWPFAVKLGLFLLFGNGDFGDWELSSEAGEVWFGV